VSRNGTGGPEEGSRPLPPRLDPRAGRPPRGRSAPAAGSGSRRATVVARGLASMLSVALLFASGWGWHLGRVAEANVHRTDAIPANGNDGTGFAPEAVNVLLVGNDSRADLTEEQLAALNAGEDSGTNTDTMMLVHLPADGSRASFVSFPRDSYVDIPGYGPDKLNAAYAYGYQAADPNAEEEVRRAGGQQLLVQTISSLTGLQIDHYAEVDLLGFFELSSVVGGVDVNLCEAVDDRQWSGASFTAGKHTIAGAEALKFVRQRHGLPRGDYDRIVRQQVFIAGVLRKMLSEEVLLDLGKQRELVQAAAKSLTIDRDLNLMQLAEQMQSVRPDDIDFQTVPYVGDDRDEAGRSIIRLQDTAALHTFFAELSAEPEPVAEAPAPTEAPAVAAPGDVTVEVFNGTGTSGLAASAATALGAAGFGVGATGNADSATYTRTEIRHAAGEEALARAVAARIPGAAVKESPDPAAGTVQVVLGSDFTTVGEPVTASAPAPAAATEGADARTAADTTCIN
jgi:LCP family protein required for cell wall assembly